MRSIVLGCVLALVGVMAVASPVLDRLPTAQEARAASSSSATSARPTSHPTPATPRQASPFVRVTSPALGVTDRVVVEHGTTGGRLFATVEGRTQLFRSDDAGRNWKTLLTPAGTAARIALVGRTLALADPGKTSQALGRTAPGSIWRSLDLGETWQRGVGVDATASSLLESVVDVYGWDHYERGMFLALSVPHPSFGAAVPPTDVLASLDGLRWKYLGQLPGWGVLGGGADNPLVSFVKNVPVDGTLRVEGTTLDTLRLAPVRGSLQAWAIYLDPTTKDLWSAYRHNLPSARRSSDGGATWRDASAGDSLGMAGFFRFGASLYGFNDDAGIRRWDGQQWRAQSWTLPQLLGSADADGYVIAWGADGSIWRAAAT